MGVLLGASASASAVALSHKVALVLTLVMLVASGASFAHGAAQRRGYGPLVLCVFASPLLLANPIVNLLEDFEFIDNFEPLNVLLNVITWVGVLEIMTASVWNASLDRRMARCWARWWVTV
eukprot:g2901.t1